MALEGPAAHAVSVLRAASGLLPAAALMPFVQRMSAAAEESLRSRMRDARAVNAAHVLSQLMRDAPSQVAESAPALVAWVMDDLLQSDAVQDAADRGCMEHMLDLTVRCTMARG